MPSTSSTTIEVVASEEETTVDGPYLPELDLLEIALRTEPRPEYPPAGGPRRDGNYPPNGRERCFLDEEALFGAEIPAKIPANPLFHSICGFSLPQTRSTKGFAGMVEPNQAPGAPATSATIRS